MTHTPRSRQALRRKEKACVFLYPAHATPSREECVAVSHVLILPSIWRGTGAVKERSRLIARMEQSVAEETNPELRQVYAQAIIVLQKNSSSR